MYGEKIIELRKMVRYPINKANAFRISTKRGFPKGFIIVKLMVPT
jgi:hypothetical protein